MFTGHLKVGDTVRIIACNHGHGLKIGSEHKIDKVTAHNYNIASWAVEDCEVQLIRSAYEAAYRIGDTVRIIDNIINHCWDIGQTITIAKIREPMHGYPHLYSTSRGDGGWFKDTECEPINCQSIRYKTKRVRA